MVVKKKTKATHKEARVGDWDGWGVGEGVGKKS